MEEFLENYSKELPLDCINRRKQFEACKQSVDPEFILNKPLSRTKGCREHFNAFNNCVDEFNHRYMKLKNLVAEINGEQAPFDITKEQNYNRRNLTKFNFGLNKF
jgi:hypothetical protein